MKVTHLFPRALSGEGARCKLSLIMVLSAFLACPLRAQDSASEPPPAPPQSAPQQLSQEELKNLVAPVALYPDALIALILPASTVPSDLVLAERYIASNGDLTQIANQPWDDSVKSLVRYPDVLKWMDQNLEWTTTLGEVFLDQPADVMNSIQALRAEAIAAGNLTDSPQQHIVREKTCVRIVPAQPDVIYVPQYDPEVVYVQPYSEDVGPLLTFSAGFAVGSWLNYDCDWDRRGIYVGQWRHGWNQYRNWDRGDRDPNWDHRNEGPNWDRGDGGQNWDRGDRGQNWDRSGRGQNNGIVKVVNINSDTARQWQPSVNSQHRQAQYRRSNRASARFSSVNALDANGQSGGASGTAITRGAGLHANHIPKPSRLDFTNQPPNGRIRRNEQASNGPNTSGGFPSSPSVGADAAGVINATPGGRGKNHKLPAPTVAPNVPGQQGTPLQGGNPRNSNKHAQGGDQNLPPDAAGVTNATPGGRGKNHKVSAPAVAPNVQGQQGTAPQSGGPAGAPRNLSKHALGGHHSTGPVTNQQPASPSTGSTQKHQKHVDQARSSPPQSNNTPRPSDGQKHQQKHAPQSAPSFAKQNKPSQPPRTAAHHDQHSQRTAAPAHQNAAPQPSSAPHGKGKGGGEKKPNEKKNKGAN